MLFILLIFGLAAAHEAVHPTHPHQLLIGTMIDVGFRVESARTVAFNRPRLEYLYKPLRTLSDEHMRECIARECGYINNQQLALTNIRNLRIPITMTGAKPLYVSPGAGRVSDIEAFGGIVNLKANGHTSWNKRVVAQLLRLEREGQMETARRLDHASGLEVYWVATAEYLRHFQLQANFNALADRGGPRREAAEALFLMDFGIRVAEGDEWVPAFVLGREPHFGRLTAAAEGSDPETTIDLYDDFGRYQTTYSGARIDFGGVRVAAEQWTDWQERARRAGPEHIGEFVAEELSKMRPKLVMSHRPVPRAPRELLETFDEDDERKVDPAIMGPAWDNFSGNVRGESPDLARLKWRLHRQTPDQLTKTLAEWEDRKLIHLLKSAKGILKIPLPRAAYEHALTRSFEVREHAVSAALFVINRFPSLVPKIVDEVAAAIERPEVNYLFAVREVLFTREPLPQLPDLLLRAIRSENWYVRDLAEERLHMLLETEARAESSRIPMGESTWARACAEELTE